MKNKIFSCKKLSDLEGLINEWITESNVIVVSQDVTYNSDMFLYVMSIMYKDKPLSL